MILFAGDEHYGSHSAKNLYGEIGDDYEMDFTENDWSVFEESFVDKYDLLILNMISGANHIPAPIDACEAHVLEYAKSGKPMLLIHGGSAAFCQWDWWRRNVGLRWCRGEDDVESSQHPHHAMKVVVSKTRHPLCQKLSEMNLPEDEVYTAMEQVNPSFTLMETTIESGTWPQCIESQNEWGGRVIGFLPGHAPEATTHPDLVRNVKVLIDDLLA
ncbi:MAG: ThuA domain-containing protein [Lentisphaeria bacterium]|nr:ThuA domain-containing protein [Lentisphaeria bacterium]